MDPLAEAKIGVIIPTLNRAVPLRRALQSLAGPPAVRITVLLVDNGGTLDLEALTADLPFPCRGLRPGRNLGPGGGVAYGLRVLLEETDCSHGLIMDDDAELAPGALARLGAGLHRSGAAVATPLISDEQDRLNWFPGPLRGEAWEVIRSGASPREFLRRCGGEERAWSWAPWICLLATRSALARAGAPRGDIWYQGVDIEFTLRLSARERCVLVPEAGCRHFQVQVPDEAQRAKDYCSLQNNTYIATRLRHGWRALRHLPGNHYRHWRRWRGRRGAWAETWRAFWRGAVCGRPVSEAEYRELTGRP